MYRYRVGFPFWKFVAQAGIPLRFRIRIHHDKESNSYWAESPDLDGLAVSGMNLDELHSEVRSAAGTLLNLALHGKKARAEPVFRLRDDVICVA